MSALERAKQKLQQGQELTPAERSAIDRARETAIIQSLRSISPKTFCEIFGIQNVQRYQWEETLQVPCGRGRESIDLFQVGAAFKKIMSKRMELAADTPDIQAKKIQKLDEEIEKLKLQNFEQRTENELLARERLPKTLIMDRLERLAAVLRGIGEQMARKSKLAGAEAQRMLNHGIAQYERELEKFDTL